MILIFSKDRAFQLEACLRTLLVQCQDVADVPIRVLWTASKAEHRQSYAILRESLRQVAHLHFVEESSFRLDLILTLGGVAPGSGRDRVVRLLQKANLPGTQNLKQAVTARLLRPPPAVLFAVDDTLFLRPFRFADCARLLMARSNCLAFSLRLGRGLTQFYMGDREQHVPELTPIKADICQYQWTDADGDFAYPLEVSSSLLKTPLILSRLLRKKWRSPNTLELALAHMAGRYKQSHPLLLTFREPRAVAVPLNMVQKDFTDNRVGGDPRYEADSLCRLFLDGVRADLSPLDQLRHTAVHVELDLLPAPHLR